MSAYAFKKMTSQSHPLQIGSIKMLGPWGELGLTFCPGKKDKHARFGHWDRDLGTDLDAIKAWGASAVVTLIEPHEFELLGVERLGEGVAKRGMSWYHLPIRDVSIPDANFEGRWQKTGPQLLEKLRSGQSILVHCRGGLGRAGLVAARLIIETRVPADKAIRAVRAARPGAIETKEQEDYVISLPLPSWTSAISSIEEQRH
jgi:ADP-ribosyl-[dinitrogen reductase] hydrolase